MKIQEVLLSPSGESSADDLMPQVVRDIDMLKQSIMNNTDRLYAPGTTRAAKEFLKHKIKDDYHKLRAIVGATHEIAEQDAAPVEQYEVYDRKTGWPVPGRGPYSTKARARAAVDKLDNAYGGYRYAHRPVKSLSEAVNKLPLTDKDFDYVSEIMEHPLPAAVAKAYIQEVIDDDEFNDIITSIEDDSPTRDVRPLIAEWFKRVMPDQLYRFVGEPTGNTDGNMSTIHGYDPHMYKNTDKVTTGNPFGKI